MSVVIIDKPKVEIESSILEEISQQVHEAGQVVLHFLFECKTDDTFIRIWKTSYLYDLHSDHRSELVHIENITYNPMWTYCKQNSKHYFTLIFTGLPKSCLIFDFKEECSKEHGAFHVDGIVRNKTDVYYLRIN